jgi:5-methylcytosine-specific restriction endonuclease McrA
MPIERVRFVGLPAGIPVVGRRPRAWRETRAECNRFYAGVAWRRFRREYLFDHPLCEDCLERGIFTAATIVHHVKERLARPDLAYEPSNMRSSCGPCHTRRHKGGDPLDQPNP